MVRVLPHIETEVLLDKIIDDYFEQSIQNAEQIDVSYKQLWETLHGLMRSGGKRLRPKMTLLSYEAFGGKDSEKIIPVAAAQELLHFSLLIHDDVIDRDYTRHGTPNIAGTYKTIYLPFVDKPTERTHFAHSAAILGGDLMLSASHELIASSPLASHEKSIAQQLIARSIFEVAGGELLDTESSFVPYIDGQAVKIARYKTAGYSFEIPLMTGARIAGISDEYAVYLREFSHTLGIAFQLVDDLLGVFGEEEMTGKSTVSDITEGKRTYMVEQANAAMSAAEKKQFEQTFGNPDATISEIESAKQLLVSSGAKAMTEQEIKRYAKEARTALHRIKISEKYREEFEKLIAKVTERTF